VQKQISIPGGHIGVYEQTIGGKAIGRFTAHLVLGGNVVKTGEDATASKAVAEVATWLHGLTASVSEIAAKLRRG
jgi:hypothetical protein